MLKKMLQHFPKHIPYWLERKRKVVFHEGTTMLNWQEGGGRTEAVLRNAVIVQGSFLKPE